MKVYPQNVIISFRDPTDDRFCRICYDDSEDISPLLSPCGCSGTMKFVHDHCLREWIKVKKKKISQFKCELCKKKLFIKKSFVEENFKLLGSYNTCAYYFFEYFFILFILFFVSFSFFLLDKDHKFQFINDFDLTKDKVLFKIIKNPKQQEEGLYFYVYFNFTMYFISILYLFISNMLAFYYIHRKKLFFSLNLQTNLVSLLYVSLYIFLYFSYLGIQTNTAAKLFIYASIVFSSFNWLVLKAFTYYFNESVKIMNQKYSKIVILNATLNPMLRDL